MATQNPILICVFIVAATFIVLAVMDWRKVAAVICCILEDERKVERLLADIRDGTKVFYEEKRRAERVGIGDESPALAIGNKIMAYARVVNISLRGVLLKGMRRFNDGEVLDLCVRLPIFVEPIEIRARVVRVVSLENGNGQPKEFDVGIEFLGMKKVDEEKLEETIKVFSSSKSYN